MWQHVSCAELRYMMSPINLTGIPATPICISFSVYPSLRMDGNIYFVYFVCQNYFLIFTAKHQLLNYWLGDKSMYWPDAWLVYQSCCNLHALHANSHRGRDKMAAFIKHTFLNKNVLILIEITMKFVRKGPINNIPEHWFRWWFGADQATSNYLNQWWLSYWRIYASPGLK